MDRNPAGGVGCAVLRVLARAARPRGSFAEGNRPVRGMMMFESGWGPALDPITREGGNPMPGRQDSAQHRRRRALPRHRLPAGGPGAARLRRRVCRRPAPRLPDRARLLAARDRRDRHRGAARLGAADARHRDDRLTPRSTAAAARRRQPDDCDRRRLRDRPRFRPAAGRRVCGHDQPVGGQRQRVRAAWSMRC